MAASFAEIVAHAGTVLPRKESVFVAIAIGTFRALPGRMRRILTVLLLAFLGACGSSPDSGTTCVEALDGRGFVHGLDECGLCECGETSLCDWVAEFDGEQLSWNYSDIQTSLEFTCAEGVLRDAVSGRLLGSYDAENDELQLDGYVYAPCDGECPRRYIDCDC